MEIRAPRVILGALVEPVPKGGQAALDPPDQVQDIQGQLVQEVQVEQALRELKPVELAPRVWEVQVTLALRELKLAEQDLPANEVLPVLVEEET